MTGKGRATLVLALALTACGTARRSNVEQVATDGANACAGIEFPAELWTDDVQAKVRAGLTGFHKPTNDPQLDADRATRVDRVIASLSRAATHWTELRQQTCTNEALTEAERAQVDACLLATLAWRATIVEIAQSPPPKTVIGRIYSSVLGMELDAEVCLQENNFRFFEARTPTTAKARDAIAQSRAYRWLEFDEEGDQAAQQAVEASSGGGPALRAEALLELAWARQKQKGDEAEQLARQSLQAAEQAGYELGIVGARHIMARIAYDRSDYPTAIAIYQEILPGYQRLLGPERPEYPSCLNDLALTYAAAGDLDRAQATMFQATKQVEALLGKNDPLTAITYDHLGYILSEKGDLELALINYERALAVRRTVLGSDHPDTAMSWHDVGVALDNLGNSIEALPMLEHALRMRQRILGEDHLDTGMAWFSLGVAQLNARQLYESLESLTRAEAIFSDKPLDLAGVLDFRTSVLVSLGRHDEALATAEKVLAIRTQELGANHSDTADAQFSKGEALYYKGRISEALACFRTALTIYEQAEARDEESIAAVHSWIDALCREDPTCKSR